ncbi:melatonin receptor type 1A-like [Bolinopsis microptera]|uniref:melatonin receptor type 1A-like n=1 Tax=Bolinopsis microptera TaxID=2820187 RepID=UPI003078EE27
MVLDMESTSTVASIMERAGIQEYLRVLLTVLNFLTFLVAVIGNSLVLLGTIRHDLIKMDRPSLLFLQSIAVSDIVIAFSSYLIKGITLAFDRWVLGDFLCRISKIIFTTALFNEAGVIAMLSVYRVWMLKRTPARRNLINVTIIKIVLTCFFFVGAVYLTILMVSLDAKMFVNPHEHTCSSKIFSDSEYKVYAISTVIVFVFVPMFVIIVSNIVTIAVFLKHDKKANPRTNPRNKSRLNNRKSTVYLSTEAQPAADTTETTTTTTTTTSSNNSSMESHSEYARIIITLTAISTMFVISYILILVKNTMGLLGYDIPDWIVVAWPYLLSINVMMNPVIYALMNKKFKAFLRDVFLGRYYGNSVNAGFT